MAEDDITTEYDIRQSRIKIVGKLSEEKAMQYLRTVKVTSQDNLKNFQAVLKALYRTIKYYKNKDQEKNTEDIEKLLKKSDKRIKRLQKTSLDHERRKILEQLEEAEDKINEFRLAVGLDLPTSKEERDKPEEWYS